MKLRRIGSAIVFFLVVAVADLVFAQATPEPTTRPAVLQLLVPDSATATVDEKDLGKDRSVTFDQIPPGETKRVTVKVKFPDGAEEERLVDLEEGQTIPLPVPTPQPDKAVAVPLQAVDPVLAIALSPDGQFLAIGLDSNAIVFWDLKSGQPARTLLRHRAPVQTIVFSSDGKQLLSGSGDNTAILWDLSSGQPLRTFKGHTDQVMSVAFSPDGRRVLTGSMDKTAIVWDAATAQKLLTITGHTDQVFGIAFSPDGKIIATASLDKTGALWDAETGKQLFNLRGHPDGVSCVAFSPDGKTVATGSFDNSAIFWDVSTGKKLRQTGKHEIDIYGVAYTPNGRRFLTAARDEVVIMWDSATGRKLRTFLGHNSDVGGAVVSADGRLMFSCSRDGMVKLWDMATGMELASLMTDSSRKSWAVVAPDGLFDASEPGRHMMGFRFVKAVGGSLDQFFNERYHPGLLAELYQGQRPTSVKPLGHASPPLVKILSPKTRSTPTTLPISITIEATDQGGGISSLRLFNNGVPIATQRDLPKTNQAKPIEIAFDNVALAPGVNQLRVVGSNADSSWESAPADIELNYRQSQQSKGRMYILAVGESQSLAQMLKARTSRIYERVDVISIADSGATKQMIGDALADIAALTRPQDCIAVFMNGRGSMTGDQVYYSPFAAASSEKGMSLAELSASLETAAALQRVMILDLSDQSEGKNLQLSVRNGMVEKLSRSLRIYALISLHSDADRGALAKAMLSAAPGSSDLMDLFRATAEKISGQSSTQLTGIPLQAVGNQ